MSGFHLFTLAGIPVAVSPFYLLLLFFFARGELVRGLVWAVCITAALLVHEFGHALVGRYLRQQPAVLLHGFGGLTTRQRTGSDVEEALVIAMGPAAGLSLGLVAFGVFSAWLHFASGPVLMPPLVFEFFRALLFVSVTWNLLNLLPLWPLDGGQLFRLGAVRGLGAKRADQLTHGLSLVLIGGFALWALSSGHLFTLLVLALLGMQNVRALRGEVSSGVVHDHGSHESELVTKARAALDAGEPKEAARLAHQARAGTGRLPKRVLDEIWEILGLANAQLGEHEEALSYLRRAQPTAVVREATHDCLIALDRADELEEFSQRWQQNTRGRNVGRALAFVLSFIAVAVLLVFTTRLSLFFL